MKGNISISAAKLVTPKGKNKNDWWLKIDLIEIIDGKENLDEKTRKNNPHHDLVNAFSLLGKHIAALACQYNDKGELDTANIGARGYSLKDDDEKSGITITGQRTVMLNRSATINTPFLNWQRTDDYPEMKELSKLVDKCNEEVNAYLFEDKFHEENQMSLPLDETPQLDARSQQLKDIGFVKKDNYFDNDGLKVEVVEIESYSDKDWKSFLKKISKKVAA